jgi:hypothetical protein
MGPEDDDQNKREYSDSGIFYLDSQWGAINRGNERDLLESQKNRPPLFERDQAILLDEKWGKKFLPGFPIQTEVDEYELFDKGSGCICAIDKSATDLIADAIFDLPNDLSPRLQPAGYTYLAQLLTHDIVSSTTLHRHREISPSLNLDSMYFEYDELLSWGGVDENGVFTFSNSDTDLWREKWTVKELKCEKFPVSDVRTEPYHFAVIPEHRNDGNAIISQLHLLFQKVHNRVVELLIEEDKSQNGPGYFNKAKQIVVLIFQQITVNDLLKVTLDPDTFEYYFVHRRPSLFPNLAQKKIIPKEFTHAVSRYAHSMIRPSYIMNNKNLKAVRVEKIFNKNRPLKEKLIIDDWGFFFDKQWPWNHQNTNVARRIKLKTSKLSVSNGPVDDLKNPAKNLAKFDIAASAELCTFSSVMRTEQVKNFFKYVKGISKIEKYFDRIDYNLINKKLASTGSNNIVLDNDNSPFLVSMLLESRAMPQIHNEDRMGIIGSIIYAETVKMSMDIAEVNMYQDHDTLSEGLDWGFPVYKRVLGSIGPMTIRNMSDLNF